MDKHLSATLFIYLALFVMPLSLSGQKTVADNTRYQNAIYEAYILNEMPQWEQTLLEMEARYKTHPGQALLYDILLAQYGLIGYMLGTEQKDKASRYLKMAEARLEELENMPGRKAAALTFASAFTAFRIGLQPIRAVQLGPRSYRLLDQALEADNTYPRLWIEKGNSAFFTPPVFGGSKQQAIDHYSKAIGMLERNMPNNYRWLYLSTLVSLANAYEKTGQPAKAIQTLEKALAFEPRFRWVKEEMLPKLRAENP